MIQHYEYKKISPPYKLFDRIVGILNNTGLSNQAIYQQDQLEPISNALTALQTDNSSISDACHCWLKLINDDILHPYREKINHRLPKQ